MTTWIRPFAVAALALTAAACADQLPTSPVELSPSAPRMSVSSTSVASVTVTPSSQTLSLNETRSLAAIPYNSSGSMLSLVGRTVTWKSSDPAVVSVDGAGRATALAGGVATITGTIDGVPGTSVITVNAPLPAASVWMHKTALSIVQGKMEQVFATPVDANGNPVPGNTITWSSSDPAVATVSSSGEVQALTAGTVVIKASVAGVSNTMEVAVTTTAPQTYVSSSGIAKVVILPGYQMMEVENVRAMGVMLLDRNGKIIPLNGRRVRWRTSNAAVASNPTKAQVLGVAPGFATITATVEGVTGSAEFAITKKY